MTLLLLIRHGENDVMRRRLAGRMPGVSLNARGQQQAADLTAALTHAPLQAVYSSPLERAMETAEPLAAAHGLAVIIRPALIEVDYGKFQGRTFGQLKRIKLWQTLLKTPTAVRFPGGETFAEVQQRVVADLEALISQWQPPEPSDPKNRPAEPVIAVVAHADIVRLALTHYLNMPLDDFLRLMVAPTSLSILQADGISRPRVICVNQQPHFNWPEPPQPKRTKKVKPA